MYDVENYGTRLYPNNKLILSPRLSFSFPL